ncbi:MAG UNVERIFIED_CONTAM: MFS transporter [Rickettsiaceae bacterium]|jgi:MHS family proline/betaine transporter-like MFS transporter
MSAKNRRSVFLSAISGNILEYYDFTVYSVFSVILGKTFFPEASEFIQILSSLAVFAVGFVTRPIGGVVFGYIGDRYGRKVSLICSISGMTVTTFGIGFLPGHDAIGALAPVLLVIFRLIQGLCISGEGAGAAIFVLEHFGKLRPGLITGIVNASNITGTLLASFVGILIGKYFGDAGDSWRYAFMLGGVMGLFGAYLRMQTSETPIFLILAKKKKLHRAPFLQVVKNSWHFMILTAFVGGVASSVVYIIKTYVNVFYSNIMHYDNSSSLLYLSYASIVLMLCMPIAGALSDYIGRAKTLKIAAIMQVIFTSPVMYFMASENTCNQIIGLTLLGILGGMMAGGAYIFVISLFKPEERFSGVSFSYNLGVALFGGTAPMISRWLVEVTGIIFAPAFYIMLVSIAFLISIYILRRHVSIKIRQNAKKGRG